MFESIHELNREFQRAKLAAVLAGRRLDDRAVELGERVQRERERLGATDHVFAEGVFSGTFEGVGPDGHGVVRGFTGPHRVLVSARVVHHLRVGQEYRYRARVYEASGDGQRVAVVTEVLHQRNKR